MAVDESEPSRRRGDEGKGHPTRLYWQIASRQVPYPSSGHLIPVAGVIAAILASYRPTSFLKILCPSCRSKGRLLIPNRLSHPPYRHGPGTSGGLFVLVTTLGEYYFHLPQKTDRREAELMVFAEDFGGDLEGHFAVGRALHGIPAEFQLEEISGLITARVAELHCFREEFAMMFFREAIEQIRQVLA